VGGFFKTHLNPRSTHSLSINDCKSLAHEFSTWAPGPELFQENAEVQLKPREDTEYKDRKGIVVLHSHDNPCVVTVRLESNETGSVEEVVDVQSTIVHFVHTETSSSRKKRVLEDLNTLEALQEDIIGYNEFRWQDRLEREYWMTLAPLTCPVTEVASGQDRHKLCVMHVQYSGLLPESSQVVRASIRLTKSVVCRTRQDKCRVCAECTARRGCAQCKQFFIEKKNPFRRHDECTSHRNCILCPEFKWAAEYGVVSPGPGHSANGSPISVSLDRVKGILEKCDLAQSNWMSDLPISFQDFEDRRFAFIQGNDIYADPKVKDLTNCVTGAQALADKVKLLGFHVYKDGTLRNLKKDDMQWELITFARTLPQNAVVLIYLAGHGMELQGEQYFLPADFKQEAVVGNPVQNALTSCVSLGWIRTCINRVLRHDGLVMVFSDICRDNELKHESLEKILRGEAVTEQELDVQLEASRQEMKRLMMEEVLNGRYFEKWTQSWAEVRSRITDILVQCNEHHTSNASNAVFRAPPCVQFDLIWSI